VYLHLYYFDCVQAGADTPNIQGLAYSTCDSWDGVNDRCTTYSEPIMYIGDGVDTEYNIPDLTLDSYLLNLSRDFTFGKQVASNDTLSTLYVPVYTSEKKEYLILQITNDDVDSIDIESNSFSIVKGPFNGVLDYHTLLMYYDTTRHCMGPLDFWTDPSSGEDFIFNTINKNVWVGTLETLVTTQDCYGSDIGCEDGYYCNGYEQCYTTLNYSGTTEELLYTCGKGINKDPCTDNGVYCDGVESCDEDTDYCSQDAMCGANWCLGEQCCYDVLDMCLEGTGEVDCDDSNACTDDECDSELEECVNTCNATTSESICCVNAACVDDPICTGILSPCTTSDLYYKEDFDDQDIDDPPVGSIHTGKLKGELSIEDTDYVLDTAGYGGYGYAFDPVANNDSHIIWNYENNTWPTDELFISMRIKHTNVTSSTGQYIGILTLASDNGNDRLELEMRSSSSMYYSIYTDNILREDAYFTTSHISNNDWHTVDVYYNFTSGVLRVWYDNSIKLNRQMAFGFLFASEVSYINFFGRDKYVTNTYDRMLDQIQVWTTFNPYMYCSSDWNCDNGVYCDGEEECISELCASGSTPCTDAVTCTVDTCTETTGECTHTPSDILCDDSDTCTIDTCDVKDDCEYACNADYPNNPCCGETACDNDGSCISTATVHHYESFDDEEVNTPLYALGDDEFIVLGGYASEDPISGRYRDIPTDAVDGSLCQYNLSRSISIT